jgi:hypothetical protein
MMLSAVRIWILISTLLVSAGWGLSALHQLNRAGYTGVFLLAAAAWFWAWKRFRQPPGTVKVSLRRGLRRFRRPAPLLFLVLVLLSLLSGSLYAGLNWDANVYRMPRVLHWLGAGYWHWIHTGEIRMNVTGCGFEWLSAPLILFTGTDRFLFLINWASYLMLPGLIFSVFTRLQVRPRVAWWWMWFFSSGWCFALQAGSVANDSFAAIYILAAVDLVLRARENNRTTDFWLSLLAAALATGVKQTNIPLALLWLAAAWPARRLMLSRPLAGIGVVCLGLLVSIVPITVANLRHTGTWLPLNFPEIGNFKLNPFWGIVGNAIAVPAQNLLPPFYILLPPYYARWNDVSAEFRDSFLHSSFGGHFSSFENFLLLSHGHGITEENTGVGLGVCILLLIAAGEAWRHGKTGGTTTHNRQLWLLRMIPWCLLLIFMAKVGSYQNARQLAPYYAFLLPVFLVRPGQGFVARQSHWQRLGLAVMALTAVMIVTSVDRPLFPAQSLIRRLYEKFPGSSILIAEYSDYRSSYFRVCEARRNYLKQILPRGERTLGYYAGSFGLDEIVMWQPLDGHRVVRILPEDTPEQLRQQGIRYAVVDGLALQSENQTARHWLEIHHADLIAEFPPIDQPDLVDAYYRYYLVHLKVQAQQDDFRTRVQIK